MKNKVIIAGSRDVVDYELVADLIEQSKVRIDEIVCGQAKGVDTMGMYYGFDHSIPIKYFPADWKQHGKAAGSIRNLQMVEYTDAAIFIINRFSSGSMHCLNAMRTHMKPFICYHITRDVVEHSKFEYTRTFDLVSIETENGTIDQTDPRFIACRSRVIAHSDKSV
jgi:hypothetical protein